MRTTRILGPLAAAMLLASAACGGGGETTDGQDGQAASPTDGGTPMQEAEPTVAVADTSLGEILVDAEGMTLYMFDPDEQGESTCYDDCATAWPPLVVEEDPVAGEGADESLLGTVERDDGAMQVTYNDWPLYYWQQDTEAGDTTGQAVNDVWWVVGPDGEPIRES